MYILDPYFINIGRKCGLLPKCENKVLALIKNKLQTLKGTPTKYHDLFILGYRDGLRMDENSINEMLTMPIPTYSTFKKNAQAQIAGFKLARKHKFNL